MNDLEYDILDELYFLTSFDDLLKKIELREDVLAIEMFNLIEKGWVRALEKGSDEMIEKLDFFYKNYKNYNYLATKQGLLAHNSR